MRGFTLIELMVATFIFAMVVSGLSVIYATVYKQGLRNLRETRIKASGLYAMRAIEKELMASTWVINPANGTKGTVLEGYQNYAPTYDPSKPFFHVLPSQEIRWFHFCGSATASSDGVCADGTQNELGCLWKYTGTMNPGGSIPNIGCGDPGNGRELLASSVFTGETGSYFSRVSAGDDVQERNQVRVSFIVRKSATVKTGGPPVTYRADSTFALGFSDN